jgi:RNA polymerase sigma factor (sigma-70 family)
VEPTDAQLLERFVRDGDESAFAALVERYGPMVMGACRRVLDHAQEAEDAFQATFLLLVRKARTLKHPERLSNWLYGVACRIARKARARAARRAHHERQASSPLPPPPDPALTAAWRELRAQLDEELQTLPAKYRAPLVLCYLDGLTNEQAAHRLGWPTGSISYRLARGRELLRDRLRRRFPNIPPPLFALLPVGCALISSVPAELIEAVVKLGMALLNGTRDAAAIVPAVEASRRVRRVVLLLLVPALLAGALFAARAWSAAPAASTGADPPSNGASSRPCH